MFNSFTLLEFLLEIGVGVTLSDLHTTFSISKKDLGVRLLRFVKKGLVDASEKKPKLYSISEYGKIYISLNKLQKNK